MQSIDPSPGMETSLGETKGPAREPDLSATARRLIVFLAVCALGISAIMTQLTLMRELLIAFSGNEIIFGIILGNWLLLTGIGSYLGKTSSKLKHPLRLLAAAQILIAILPIADVFAVRALRNVVFIRGALVGVAETFLFCFVLLVPYCVISGYLLTLACSVLASKRDPSSIGQVYFMDNIGDILGGLLFSFVLVYLFDHFGILYVPAFLNLFFAMVLAWLVARRVLIVCAITVAVALLGLISLIDLDAAATDIQYAGRKVVYQGHSPYGRLIVTESAGQYNFIENGVPLFSTHNVEQVEETIHYAMVQRPDAKKVLLVSGGISGTAKEILKYGVDRVDYVELDPMIVQVGRTYVPEHLSDDRITIIHTDGRRFVKTTPQRYDVVIVDVPDPSTFQINRFYTHEFLREAKAVLTEDGVLSFSLGHYENYLSPELARLISVAYATAGNVFSNVLMVPGAEIFFLASDGPIYSDIAARIERGPVKTDWVTGNYLRATLTEDRIADVYRAISTTSPINRDFSPVLYYYHLSYWISQFKVRYGLLMGFLGLCFAAYLFRLRAVPFAIFTTGFAASTLVIVLLVGFQILYGYLYHEVARIVTMFMIGLAIGSFTMNRMLAKRGRADLIRLELGIAAYAAVLPFVMMGLGRLGGTGSMLSAQVIFPVMTVLLAALVGMEFPLAGKADFKETATTAAGLYTADFAGACLGAILVSTVLIPVIGVVGVCLTAAALNVLSAAVIWLTGKR